MPIQTRSRSRPPEASPGSRVRRPGPPGRPSPRLAPGSVAGSVRAAHLGRAQHGPGISRRGGDARGGHEEEVQGEATAGRQQQIKAEHARTLPTSWESKIWWSSRGALSRASSAGVSSVLSRCMCGSSGPAGRPGPPAQWCDAGPSWARRRRSSRQRRDSAGSTRSGKTLTTCPPVRSRSAGSRPRATRSPLEQVQVARGGGMVGWWMRLRVAGQRGDRCSVLRSTGTLTPPRCADAPPRAVALGCPADRHWQRVLGIRCHGTVPA